MIRDSWLTEIAPDAPCGPDLEYDQDFLALERATQGKPEQQYGDKVFPAEEPGVADVPDLAHGAHGAHARRPRSPVLLRALTRTQGLPGTVEAMQLMPGLLERFWDDGILALVIDGEVDPMMRMNALAALTDRDKLLRDIRGADFLRTPASPLTVRDVESILDQNVGKSDAGARRRPAARRRSPTRSRPIPRRCPSLRRSCAPSTTSAGRS